MQPYNPRTEPHDEAAMSFKEIGESMGITRGGAWMLYRSALRKLRKDRGALRQLQELVDLKNQKFRGLRSEQYPREK